jgi:hypothetical protein
MAKLGYTWYPKDWGNSESVFELNLSQRGLYRELIDLAMLQDNKVEYKPKTWARKFAVTENDILDIIEELKKLKLVELNEGFLFIPSCEKRLVFVRSGKEGGKGNTKGKTKGIEEGNTKGKANQRERETKIEIEKEIESKEDMSGNPDPFIIYIDFINKVFGREFKYDSWKSKVNTKLKKLMSTYKTTSEFGKDLAKVCTAIYKEQYHKETDYKHITPEFVIRIDKFEKYLNAPENKGMIKETRHEYVYNFESGGTERNKFTEAEHLAYLEKYKNAKLAYRSKSEVESD